MLDIHALHIFYEAAQARSFTAAAHALNMTQPAVSMQIKALEDHLQVKLFQRSGRTMQLTKAGQALLPRAKEILDMAINTEQVLRTANDEVMGDLVIGCSVPAASQVLIRVAAQFQQQYPLVRIRIPTVSKEELINKLTSGQYDFGIMNIVDRCDSVECLPFFKDEIVLIASVDHPFSQETHILPQDLRGERFVCQGPDSACRYVVKDALRPYGVDTSNFDVRMEIGSYGAIVSAVAYGIGLAFVSRLETIGAVSQGTVRTIRIDGVDLRATVGIGYSNTHATSLAALKFKAFITHANTRAQIAQMTHEIYPFHMRGHAAVGY